MNCPKCGKEVGNSRFCPECGADMSVGPAYVRTPEPKKKKKKRGWIVFLILIVIVAVASLSMQGTENGSNPDASEGTASTSTSTSTGGDQSQAPKQNLEIIDYTSTSDNYLRYATGHIRNNTNKTYSYVQVEINLYSGDTLVGSTLDNVTNLAPGDVWEFKALITEDSADSFKIIDVTGW